MQSHSLVTKMISHVTRNGCYMIANGAHVNRLSKMNEKPYGISWILKTESANVFSLFDIQEEKHRTLLPIPLYVNSHIIPVRVTRTHIAPKTGSVTHCVYILLRHARFLAKNMKKMTRLWKHIGKNGTTLTTKMYGIGILLTNGTMWSQMPQEANTKYTSAISLGLWLSKEMSSLKATSVDGGNTVSSFKATKSKIKTGKSHCLRRCPLHPLR